MSFPFLLGWGFGRRGGGFGGLLRGGVRKGGEGEGWGSFFAGAVFLVVLCCCWGTPFS